MIEIDGSYGEGGGQVLRTALSLAALTGRSVRLRAVRAGRRNPGLAPQHLTVVRALARVCAAEVEGAGLRSTEITFRPGSPSQAGDYTFDVADAAEGGSAGSVTLLAQALLLPLAFAGGQSRLTLKGGTHVRWSPSFEYLDEVYLPAVGRLGLRAECTLDAWGFYPAGGGQVSMLIGGLLPEAPRPAEFTERGELRRIWGVAVASNLPAHIPQRMTDRARSRLAGLSVKLDLTPKRVRDAGPGAGIFLVADYEAARAGFAGHGERGKPSEAVAEEACAALLAHHNANVPVDGFLADQLLLPMALAQGRSSLVAAVASEHLKTNAYVIQQFLRVQITIAEPDAGSAEVVVDGAGGPACLDDTD